jgi:hypothetical protein
MSVIAWIVIGLLAGWLATRIMGGRGGLMRNRPRVTDGPRQAATIFHRFSLKTLDNCDERRDCARRGATG